MAAELNRETLELIQKSAKTLAKSHWTVALTGAGISVDSGIPDFRSPGGLWERFDPFEYAHIDAFRRNPEKVWQMLKEMSGIVRDAKPNPGHVALAKLEEMGILKAVITQNIDNLHQRAGSKNVIEYHGNGERLVCPKCGKHFPADEAEEKGEFPPKCDVDGTILKPDVVFFGEAIPFEALIDAQHQAQECNVMLVVGTSGMVQPAAGLPYIAKNSGSTIIEVNPRSTVLTSSVVDIYLCGSSSIILPILAKETERELHSQ